MQKLFGTDGVRGIANTELSAELAYKLGRAGAYVLTKAKKHKPRLIIANDTRRSAFMLRSALVAGVCSVGGDCALAGVLPTPAAAYLARSDDFDAGVMITASHNTYPDNGIKFFDHSGFKLPDALEAEIEQLIADNLTAVPSPVGEGVGIGYEKDFTEEYIAFLLGLMGAARLDGLKVALDCANGAVYKAAPEVFKRLGARVSVINDKPDGMNINAKCGSTHLEGLTALVKQTGADIGAAFDGDGDRCLLIDEYGKIIKGDEIMSVLACHMKETGRLKNNTLVATVMSNLGLYKMGEREGIHIEQTSVGDRYVLERMLAGGFNLGGEDSGHIIFLDNNPTGDGIQTALMVMKLLTEKGCKFSELNNKMTVMPQVLINANVRNDRKYTYMENDTIKGAVAELEARFEGRGRAVIRPSGTESYIRVMIEGEDQKEIEQAARGLADVIERELA